MIFGTSARAQTGEDSRTALAFLKDLRDHFLHDIALDYIKVLKADAQLPTAIKDVLDYEEGRTLIDEAAKTNDLVLREDLLRGASEKLEGFVKAHPKMMQARDAQVHMGKLLLQRGYTAMLLSEDTQDPGKKAAKVSEAPRGVQPGARLLMARLSSRSRKSSRSMPGLSRRTTRERQSAMPSTSHCSTREFSKAWPITSWPRLTRINHREPNR